MDLMPLVTLSMGMAGGAIGSLLLWLYVGLPKVRTYFEERVAQEKAELLNLYMTEKQGTVETITALFDEGVKVLASKVESTLTALAPDLIDGLVSAGQGILGKRGNMSQAASKVALEGGGDLQSLLANLDEGTIQKGLAALQGGGGSVPQGGNPLHAIFGQALLGLLPAKYRKMIPPGVNPLSLLSGMGGGGGSTGRGNGGYSPGV